MRMRKRTNMNLDVGLVREAADILGTRGTTETVHAAMADVVRRARLRRLAANDFPDLTADALREMRETRSISR